jgi:hypothetical protein
MLEIWELITGRNQYKIGKDGGDFQWKPRLDRGYSATDDDEFTVASLYLYLFLETVNARAPTGFAKAAR